MLLQFRLPAHPALVTAYLVSLCTASFFCMKALAGLGVLPPLVWLKYRPLPMVAGSLALLLQVIVAVGNFSLIQQKVVSRLPLITGLLFLAFFPERAEVFVVATLGAGCIFQALATGKARYQKRTFFKLMLFLAVFAGLRFSNTYWALVVGELFLFFGLFYLFIFEHSFAISALIDRRRDEIEGTSI
jgi:hypothetical protein